MSSIKLDDNLNKNQKKTSIDERITNHIANRLTDHVLDLVNRRLLAMLKDNALTSFDSAERLKAEITSSLFYELMHSYSRGVRRACHELEPRCATGDVREEEKVEL